MKESEIVKQATYDCMCAVEGRKNTLNTLIHLFFFFFTGLIQKTVSRIGHAERSNPED